MSTKFLGNPFDIHGGGKDLIFPHHENERAQTEAATGATFVKYWMHNGFVNIEREKMSKSIGNTMAIRDFLREYHPEVLRLFFLSTHYRNPVDYNGKSIEDTNSALHRLYYTIERALEKVQIKAVAPQPYADADVLEKEFYEAMDDDCNTALALANVFELSKLVNKLVDEEDEGNIPHIAYSHDMLLSLTNQLGLLSDDLNSFASQEKVRHLNREGIQLPALEKTMEERTEARKNKDYQRRMRFGRCCWRKGLSCSIHPKGQSGG
jgi:cysteinyl-tRNA synthetase